MRALPSCALLLLVACGELPEASSSRYDVQGVGAGIVGGAESHDDSAVFLLDIERQDPVEVKRVLCSATLIGPRSLLTAAHCLTRAVSVRASNSPRWTPDPAVWRPVQEVWPHPRYDPDRPTDYDLGIVLLRDPPGAAPRPWNARSLAGLTGASLRAVGYGTGLSEKESSGVRRSAALTFREIQPAVLRLGDRLGRGICHGDSGGPSFHVFPDGVERLVGVHSFTSREDCLDGGDVRLDAYASFVTDWLSAKDTPDGVGEAAAAGETPDPSPSCGGLAWPLLGLPWLARRLRRRGASR